MTCYVQDGTLNVTHSHPDLWLTCDHFVGKASHYGSTNQINSAFHPLGVGKFVVIHIITLNSGVETIRRQAGAAYGCLVADSKPRIHGLCLRPIGCTPVEILCLNHAIGGVNNFLIFVRTPFVLLNSR